MNNMSKLSDFLGATSSSFKESPIFKELVTEVIAKEFTMNQRQINIKK